MQIETLKDVLNWTREVHQHLASCMQHCADKNESKRARLLLDYLVDHEQKLVEVLDDFQKTTSANVLDTWCIEYLNKPKIECHGKCDKPFTQMNSKEIFAEISHRHEQVIELYRYLHSRAETPATRELLSRLLELEEHEAMRMARSANWLESL